VEREPHLAYVRCSSSGLVRIQSLGFNHRAAYQLVPEKDFSYHDAVMSETEILLLARIESLYILVVSHKSIDNMCITA
jgi:hypothetical protein